MDTLFLISSWVVGTLANSKNSMIPSDGRQNGAGLFFFIDNDQVHWWGWSAAETPSSAAPCWPRLEVLTPGFLQELHILSKQQEANL